MYKKIGAHIWILSRKEATLANVALGDPNKHYLLSPGPAGRPAQAWAWAGPYFGLLTPIKASPRSGYPDACAESKFNSIKI